MNCTFIVTALSLVGTVANVYKKRWCFVLWLFTNLFWCLYDFYLKIYSQSVLFLVYFLLAIWGLRKWKISNSMNTFDKIVTKIKVKLGFCPAKGCWKRGTDEINIKEINLKRHLCHKHTKELIKVLGGKETSEIDGIR